MSASNLFLAGMGITLLISLTTVTYLMSPLRKILTDLCGTRERADFWLAFSNVALMLTPLIFAASCTPDPSGNLVIEVATQLKWSFIGLLTALMITGWVISRFIPRRPGTSSPVVPHQSGSAPA